MTQWIAAIARGHNSGICLLKDGELVFSIEEERLSRKKYDGGPLASMIKILDYTDRLDYLVVAHTQPLDQAGSNDFTGEPIYVALARKLGLIDRKADIYKHPQVVDYSHIHHKLHSSCAFFRSGFKSAVSVIVDGAGTFIPMEIDREQEMTWELETIIQCAYPDNFKTLYKHQGGRGPWGAVKIDKFTSDREGEDGTHELILDDSAGIVKAYEAVTQYCGWAPIEAGKTMGLFPYGKENSEIPDIYTNYDGRSDWATTNRDLIVPTYPNGAVVNKGRFLELREPMDTSGVKDLTQLDNRRDLAYAIQTESQSMVLDLIFKAVEMSGEKNVVLSGGYGLNCVANYWYLPQLKEKGINLFVEPVSNDAGTAIGAAYWHYQKVSKNMEVHPPMTDLYYGPVHEYDTEYITDLANYYDATRIF